MKYTKDSKQVQDRIWYYLLDFNDRDERGYIIDKFGVERVCDLSFDQIQQFFAYAVSIDTNVNSDSSINKEIKKTNYSLSILFDFIEEQVSDAYTIGHKHGRRENTNDGWGKCANEISSRILKYLERFDNSNPGDSERLDWLQQIMTNDENYCEVYFAGLRNCTGKAGAFQIESNPEKFPTLNGKTIREAIDAAMKQYQK